MPKSWAFVTYPCFDSSLKLSIYSHISRFLKVFSVLLHQESSHIWKASSEKTNMKQEIIEHINQLVRKGEPFLFVINYQGDKAYIRKLSEIDSNECLYDFDGKANTKDLSLNSLPSKISWNAMALSYHQERMKRTMQHFFPDKDIPCLEEVIAPTQDMDFHKARVVYGEEGIKDIHQVEYRIREIRPSDDESIRKIARSAFEEFGAPLTGSVYCDPRMEHLSQEFIREDAKYWVIEGTDGEILGGGGFYPTEGLPLGMAEVVKLYFSPSLRGKGYGKKMLSLIEQEAKKVGYKELYIESFPEFAKAVSLYEKVGFKHITHALGNSGHPAVTVWMTKEI